MRFEYFCCSSIHSEDLLSPRSHLSVSSCKLAGLQLAADAVHEFIRLNRRRTGQTALQQPHRSASGSIFGYLSHDTILFGPYHTARRPVSRVISKQQAKTERPELALPLSLPTELPVAKFQRKGMMKDSSKSKCGSSSHQTMKEKAKIWVDDLQGTFAKLQSARMENRANEMVIYEQQVHLMLQEWKAELHEPSPASSLVEGSFGLLDQLLQQIEVEDDATSPFAKPAPLKSEQHLHNLNEDCYPPFQEKCFDDHQPQDLAFEGFAQFEGSASNLYNNAVNKSHMITQLDHLQFSLDQDFDHLTVAHNTNSIAQFDLYQDYKSNNEIKNSEFTQFSLPENFDCGLLLGADETKQGEEDNVPNILPNVRPPPSAFLGPKCALWECVRPAEQCQDYCSSDHAGLALNEGVPGMTPILRPWGIGIKDGPLFAALKAKTQGKEAGIPRCEGAASSKSPWNAPELFDPSLFEGETLREWLFLDKPRRAFESGNRKQRSLPDYNGRWHESRKQLMKEHGGQKRSYYMDPQPFSDLEWHLYEYEINGHDGCALYRMELKLVDKKKSPKGKVNKESLADLQNKMGRLTANVPADEGEPVKGKTKAKCGNLRSPEGDKYSKG